MVHERPGTKFLSHNGTLLKSLVGQSEEQQLKAFSQSICPLLFASDRLQCIQYLLSLFYRLLPSNVFSSSGFHSATREVQGYKLVPSICCSPHF